MNTIILVTSGNRKSNEKLFYSLINNINIKLKENDAYITGFLIDIPLNDYSVDEIISIANKISEMYNIKKIIIYKRTL